MWERCNIVFLTTLSLPGSRGGHTYGWREVHEWVTSLSLYERLWLWYLAQRHLSSSLQVLAASSQKIFHILSALGLEPRTICFSAQFPTDGAATIPGTGQNATRNVSWTQKEIYCCIFLSCVMETTWKLFSAAEKSLNYMSNWSSF